MHRHNNLVRSLTYASGGHYTPLISSLLAEISGLPVEGVKSIGLLNIATDFLLGSKRERMSLLFPWGR